MLQDFTAAVRPVFLCQSFQQRSAAGCLVSLQGIQITAKRLEFRIHPILCFFSALLFRLFETAFPILRLFRRRLIRVHWRIHRSDQITVCPTVFLFPGSQTNLAAAVFPDVKKRLSGLTVFLRPEVQRAKSGGQNCFSLAIRHGLRDRRILRIIQYLKLYLRGFRGAAILHTDGDLHGLYRRVPAQFIEHGHHALFPDPFLLLRQDVVKPPGMHHHRPGGRVGKPSLIQDRQRFTGSGKLPFSFGPNLHPRMVVITVGPFGRIDLAGRNPGASHGVDGKCRLFSTASAASLPDSQRRQRPVVRRLVRRLCGTPVVDLDCGLTALKLSQLFFHTVIEQAPAWTNLFLIDPMVQNVIQENFLRQTADRFLRLPEPDSMFRKIQKGFKRIISPVAPGHCPVHPLHCQRDRLPAGADLFIHRTENIREFPAQLFIPAYNSFSVVFQKHFFSSIAFYIQIRSRTSLAARTFSAEVRYISYSLRDGSPILTPSFR